MRGVYAVLQWVEDNLHWLIIIIIVLALLGIIPHGTSCADSGDCTRY